MIAKLRKRIIAFALCMVMVLSSGTAALADDAKTDTEVTNHIEETQEVQGESVDALGEADAAETVVEPEKAAKEPEVVVEPEKALEETEKSKEAAEETKTEADNETKTEWTQQVGDSTVKVIADAGALPKEAVLYASQITDQKEVEEIEKIVEEKSIEEQIVAEKMVAYDIKFMVGDLEVQPSTPVQVLVDTPEIENGKSTSVIHVGENDATEDMKGSVDKEGNVVFEAPHFSTYVIIQEGGKAVKVSIEHYDTNQTKIYSDDKVTLPVGGKINDYAKATNWNVVKVEVGDKTYTEEDDYQEIKLAKDTNIKVYYEPEEKTITGATTLYDYTVGAGETGSGKNKKYYSINAPENYNNNDSEQKLTSGTTPQNYGSYRSTWKPAGSGYNANDWTGNPANGQKPAVVKGLLEGLNQDGEVVFKYDDPGFFNDDNLTARVDGATRYLRQVYKNYRLSFEQKGDSYALQRVEDGTGKVVTNSGHNFYPLDGVKKSYEKAENGRNYYFGMRYDVTFTIGDYVGPLDYAFTGDDDLWVVLDGTQVVIDLGGIHNAAEGSVNLWDYIGDAEKLTPEQRQQEHTLTILYMERGAGESNCQMDFTLPSASISEVTKVPMTNLLLNKVNSENEPLAGAKFKLTNDSTGEVHTAESISNGAVQFTKLREGEYTLQETQAPSGYIPTVDEWKVKVTLDDEGNAVATVYLIDGETEAKVDPDEGGIYKVVNVTEQELINSSMDYNKTATVRDWNERTYDINITASSKLTDTSITEKGGVADGMLVLDKSGSMNFKTENKNVAEFKKEGAYNKIKNTLDTTKIYYYGNSADTPMVYLDDQWKYYNSRQWLKIADSDGRSIYTCDSRLTGLKEATTAFVSSTAAASPDSMIGVTSFNTSNSEVSPLAKIGSDATALIQNINKMFADGGTSPATGLEYAYNLLKKGKRDNVPQYVILFTDGEPTGNSNVWSDIQAQQAKKWADTLKEEGIIVYTVGLGLTDKAKGWLDGSRSIYYNGANISGIASKDCAFTADNIEDLKLIFKKIQETVTNNIDITGAQIKDVIDSRFVIFDDKGVPITKEYSGIEKGIKLQNGGTVYYDQTTGEQYVVWNDQKIPNGKDGVKWNKTITVKAREDYIGGNNVTTNISPDSKISTGFGEAVLPQPTVNVKAQLEVSNQKATLYNGDAAPTEKKILDTLFTTKYIGHYGVTAESFKLSWYNNEACSGEPIDTEALKQTKPDSDISYYLKVTYDAGEPTAESNKNTTKDKKVYIAGEDDHIVEAVNNGKQNGKDSSEFAGAKGKTYGVYKIKVISGELVITKTLQKAADTDQMFTFIIKKDEDNKSFKEVKITVPKGALTATLSTEELKKLPRGKYVITEAAHEVYGLQNLQINKSDTNCDNSSTEELATFVLGANNGNVIKDYTYDEKNGGTLGTVTFTNAVVIKDWTIVKRSTSSESKFLEDAEFKLSPSDATENHSKPTYYGRSKSNGEVEWFSNEGFTASIETANLALGSYLLTEQKAPIGYAVSQESWDVVIGKGGLLSIASAGKEPAHDSQTIGDKTIVSFYFENTPVYNLPSTGGSGIYCYMIGGMLLMFAAALILYKKRCREVLKN